MVVVLATATVINVAVPRASAATPGTTTASATRVRGPAVPTASRRGQAEVDLCAGSVAVVMVVVVVVLLPRAQAPGLPTPVLEALRAAIVGSGRALPPRAGRRQRCRWLGVAPAVAVAMDHRFWTLCGRQRRLGAGRA